MLFFLFFFLRFELKIFSSKWQRYVAVAVSRRRCQRRSWRRCLCILGPRARASFFCPTIWQLYVVHRRCQLHPLPLPFTSPSPPAAPLEQRPRQRQRRRLPMSVSDFIRLFVVVVYALLLLLLVVHIFCFSANCLLYFAITELVLSYLISQLIEPTNKELNYLLYEYICLLISQD